MNFDCLSPKEVQERYNRADDKNYILEVLADLTASKPEDVAEMLGVEYTRCVYEYTYIPKVDRKPNVKIDPEKIRALHQQGMSDREIAERLNYSVTSVGKWRRKTGLPLNPVRDKSRVSHEAALKLYHMGFTDRQIANVLGVSKSAVVGWRHRKFLPSVSQMKGAPA